MYAWPGRTSKLSVSSARKYFAADLRLALGVGDARRPCAGALREGWDRSRTSGPPRILEQTSVGEQCQQTIESEREPGRSRPARARSAPSQRPTPRGALSPAPAERPLSRLPSAAGEGDREQPERRRQHRRRARRTSVSSSKKREAAMASGTVGDRERDPRRAMRWRAGCARAAAPSLSLPDVWPADRGRRDRSSDDTGDGDDGDDIRQGCEERRIARPRLRRSGAREPQRSRSRRAAPRRGRRTAASCRRSAQRER